MLSEHNFEVHCTGEVDPLRDVRTGCTVDALRERNMAREAPVRSIIVNAGLRSVRESKERA